MILNLKKAHIDGWTKRLFYSGTSTKLGASLDVTGFPVTGLTKTEEKNFEKELQLPTGTLSRGSKWWTSFVIVIDDGGVVLDDSIPDHALRIKFLEAQSIVANGLGELKTNPRAEYVLYSEDQEKAARNKVRRVKREATNLIATMDDTEMEGMVYLFNMDPRNMSHDAIEDFLYEKCELDPQSFTLLAKDPDKETKVFILALVKKGIVQLKGGAYLYENELLAYGLEGTAIVLKDVKNQEMRIALEKRLNNA